MAEETTVALNDLDGETINGVTFVAAGPRNSGTGGYNTFLAIRDNDAQEQGFNTDGGNLNTGPLAGQNNIDASKTMSVRLSTIPVETRLIDGVPTLVYVVRIDLNEAQASISLTQFKIFTGGLNATNNTIIDTVSELNDPANATLRYNLDAGGDRTLILSDAGATGSGTDDYEIVIPVTALGDANIATDYLYLFAEFQNIDGGFEEFNLANAVALTGTKFIDDGAGGGIAGDGVRQAGEIGQSGVTIFIDTDKDGVLDVGERSTVTDANGSYTFGGVIAGTYQIDEVVPTGFRQTTGDFETVTIPSNFTPGATIAVDPIGNKPLVADFTVSKVATSITGGVGTNGLGGANSANDVVNYTITVTNTGDLALDAFTIADPNATTLSTVSGDAGNDGVLSVGEVWTVTATHTVSQAELDSTGTSGTGGLDTDSDTDNTVTVDFAQTAPKMATATTPLLPAPSIAITKVFTGWSGGDGDSVGDTAGDIANYTIVVMNTGNVTLTNVVVTDPLTGNVYGVGTLAPGASSAPLLEQYAITQQDLDTRGDSAPGNLTADGDIDNTATATSNQTGPASASATAPLIYAPSLNVTKDASVPGGTADTAGEKIAYAITLANTGNTTLTDISVDDPYADAGSLVRGTDITGDNDAVLEVGEVWSYSATHTVTQAEIDSNGDGDGQLENTVTADSAQTLEDTATAMVAVDRRPSLNVTKDASVPGGTADTAGEKIAYAITLANTGNTTLTDISVDDPYADAGSLVRGTDITGDNDAVLEVGEVWSYSATHTVTQAEIDSNGDGDGQLENTVTADSAQTLEDTATAMVAVDRRPSLNVTKDASVPGGTADTAGEKIAYAITLANTGNTTLTDISVDDPYADAGSLVRGTDITGDNDAVLEVGEVWSYSATHTVTQAELNSNGGGDGKLENTVTADSAQTDKDTADASVDVFYNPVVDLTKFVSIDGTNFIDANDATAGFQNVAVQSAIFFKVTVENTGNIDLTSVKITDVNTTLGDPGTTVTLYENGALTLPGAMLSGDDNGDSILGVGETWTITYTQGFDFGQHVNTAYVSTAEQAADDDAAHYFGIMAGPGVRTPGFWQGANNGALFWNGVQGDSKTGTGFTENGDLLIYGNTQGIGGGDANNDGVVTAADKGLLIGDYNLNGRTDAGEDTLFISFNDATKLIDSSQKTMAGDGVEKLGRDVVATWLNYLAGNGIGGENDVESPRHFIDDAVDWLQTFGDSSSSNLVNPAETFDRYSSSHAKVASSSAFWNAPQGGIDHSASKMHDALDNYNNTGDTIAGGDPYAMNSHSAFDMMLMQAAQSVTP